MTQLITHVFCLNRASGYLVLQTKRNRSRGLPGQFDSSHASLLTAELNQPSLGLQPETYSKLVDSAILMITTLSQ